MTAPVRTLRLPAHLTRSALETELAQVPPGRCDVIVDARKMDGYDADARALFVEWNAARRSLGRLAVVTPNPLYHMVVRAMALASGRPMRPFASVEDAEAWLGTRGAQV